MSRANDGTEDAVGLPELHVELTAREVVVSGANDCTEDAVCLPEDEKRNGVVRKSPIFVITRATLSDDEAE